MPQFETMMEQRKSFYAAIEQLQSGTYKGQGDYIDWTLWDRLELASTTQNHRLFVNGVGAATPGGVRTLADTNLRGNQGIPLGSKLAIHRIKIHYHATEPRSESDYQAILDMLNESTLNFEIVGKDSYGQWVLDELMGNAFGLIVDPAIAGDNVGMASVCRFVGEFPLNLPIVLASQVTFQVTIEHHSAVSSALDGDKIRFGLNGLLERLS